jgi:hypothetical protein
MYKLISQFPDYGNAVKLINSGLAAQDNLPRVKTLLALLLSGKTVKEAAINLGMAEEVKQYYPELK